MNINSVTKFQHRRSPPSSDRFLDMFSPPKIYPIANKFSDELTESDVFWNSSDSPPSNRNPGVLDALPDDGRRRVTTPFRAIPKPQNANNRVGPELTWSVPDRKYQNSAPVKVPAMRMNVKKYGGGMEEFAAGESDDEEMLPPHEIVDMKRKTTSSSVLEGVGRTLKGRDLRMVRNAVWSQTGFLD